MSGKVEKVEKAASDHDFGTMPIRKMILKYAGMMFIGGFAQVIMVIFEGIIIGNATGADGLACVGWVMPLENLQLAIGGGFTIGAGTLASIKMGEGDEEGARKVFNTSVTFIGLLLLILGIGLMVFPVQVAKFLGTPDEYLYLMVPFIRIFGVGYPFTGLAQLTNRFLAMDERPDLSALWPTVFAVLGVIWLFVTLSVMHFSIVAAGWYYAFSVGGWAIALPYFIRKSKRFKLERSLMGLNWKLLGESIKICIPYVCIQGSTAVFSVIVNNLLGKVGTPVHVAAYAILSGYVIYILNMFNQAVVSGTAPAISCNYGEKLWSRLKELLITDYIVQIVLVGIVTIIFEIFADQTLIMFGAGEEPLYSVGKEALRIIIAACALGGSMGLMSTYYVSTYKLGLATFTGVGRYLIFVAAFMLLFVNVFDMGILGVWYGQTAGDIASFICTLILLFLEIKSLNKLIAAQ